MKLITSHMSSNARRVNLLVAHLGLTLEQQYVQLNQPADRAAVAAVNPNGKIPVLLDPDHGLVLWESHAILQYLCDRNPEASAEIYPADVAVRADILRWMFWVNAHLAPVVGPFNYERLWKKFIEGPDATPDPAVIARYERFFHISMTVLEKHLTERTWAVGKTLTLADYSIVSTLMYRAGTQLPLEGYPHVQAYIARVEATDAWKATEPPKRG